MKYSLIGRCDICGGINAVDLTGTPENEQTMKADHRTVERVTPEEAARLWHESKKCDHRALIAGMRAALESIRETAMQHPCFWREAFDARDIDGLCAAGGDVCDWTLLAITADDALKGKP